MIPTQFKISRDQQITGGNFVHGDNAVITSNTYHSTSRDRWPRDKLLEHTAPNAIHDSKELECQGICMENTREAVLKLLKDYLSADILDSPALLWLNGPAGAGKSAIARTIAQSASKEGTLLASFFFYSSDHTRNTLDPLIPTLAVQICRRFPQARPHIEQAIEDDPLIFTKAAAAQADTLIVHPLLQMLPTLSTLGSSPLSILVDGLDECNDSHQQTDAVNILSDIIAKVHASSHIRLKVVIFSRPERAIRTCVGRQQKAQKAMTVTLQDEKLNPRSDIKLYYSAHFAKIREDDPASQFLDNWPSPDQMAQLVDITDNHFAFAHIMRLFVVDPGKDPREQLEIVLGIAQPTRGSPHTPIDKLFATIFSRIPSDLLPMILRIIGAILIPSQCALFPSPPLLELVFSLRQGEVRQMFSHLESLFNLGNGSSSWIHAHHKTLADFLFTPSRSKAFNLFIDKAAVYEDIHQSVLSVFRRQALPEREGLTVFVQFIKTLSALDDDDCGDDDHDDGDNDDDDDAHQWTQEPSCSGDIGNSPNLSPWQPWAVEVYNSFAIGTPSDYYNYAQQMHIDDGPRDLDSAYNCSAVGRIALALSSFSFWQTFDESRQIFYQAFIRHAIRSEPSLLELDKTIGWNLISCNSNNLVKAAIYFLSRPKSYRSNLGRQLIWDALDPNWVSSRLGMLRSWHESSHRLTDNPWEYAGCGDIVEVASESQLNCLTCLEVLELCKAEVFKHCLEWIEPDCALYRAMFDHVQFRPPLSNHLALFSTWIRAIKPEGGNSQPKLLSYFDSKFKDPDLSSIAACICKRGTALQHICNAKFESLVADGWDGGSAFQMACFPYSRACIPFMPSHEHAVRVSKRRMAWECGLELPEVVYTNQMCVRYTGTNK